ncbi:hypothetical protein [Mastigocladopsis repens]|uniref:hypothetical protein n=1 Tax=Mastigocladopsis repens TaxID=221287 RepID=UPI0002D8437C|nr:hypothetical protein [Mastigocladopsis repens]
MLALMRSLEFLPIYQYCITDKHGRSWFPIFLRPQSDPVNGKYRPFNLTESNIA